MTEAVLFATFMSLAIVGLVWIFARAMYVYHWYHDWADDKKFPFLWLDVPLLFLLWVLMFWIGTEIFT